MSYTRWIKAMKEHNPLLVDRIWSIIFGEGTKKAVVLGGEEESGYREYY